MPKLEPTRIVAFLQNQWFRDPERVKQIIQRMVDRYDEKDPQEIREFYIAAYLFMGCLTGKRLQASCGDCLREGCPSRSRGSRPLSQARQSALRPSSRR